MRVRIKLRLSPLEAVAHQVMMVLWKCQLPVLTNFYRIALVVWHSVMKAMGSKGW